VAAGEVWVLKDSGVRNVWGLGRCGTGIKAILIYFSCLVNKANLVHNFY
jgi:hypothetical protein